MNELVVVFVQDFAADDVVVLGLLHEGAPQPPQLQRQYRSDEDGRRDFDTRSRIQRRDWEVEIVQNHMQRAKQAEQLQTQRIRVPHSNLPDISSSVRMCPGRRRISRDHLLDVSHRRDAQRRRINPHALRTRRRRHSFHALFEQPVVPPLAPHQPRIAPCRSTQYQHQQARKPADPAGARDFFEHIVAVVARGCAAVCLRDDKGEISPEPDVQGICRSEVFPVGAVEFL